MAKFTIELKDEIDKILGNLTAEKGVGKADIIRQAITTYAYLQQEAGPYVQEQKLSITSTSTDEIIKNIKLP